VVTLHGVHILQADMSSAKQKIRSRLVALQEIRELEERLHDELRRQENLKNALYKHTNEEHAGHGSATND